MAIQKKTKEATTTARAPKAAPAAAKPAAPGTPMVDPRNPLEKRKSVVGTVVSNKMTKTIVVRVDRRVRHGMYLKFVVKTEKFKAHDEKNEAKIGDLVALVGLRPISREKRWVLQSIIRKAGQT